MGEKNQNNLEFFRKLNHRYLKSILSMKLTGSEVHMENAIFSPFSFLFCFVFVCLFFFALSQKSSSPNYRRFRSYLLYYTVFFNWMNLTVC